LITTLRNNATPLAKSPRLIYVEVNEKVHGWWAKQSQEDRSDGAKDC
jgi:hypothetical protein